MKAVIVLGFAGIVAFALLFPTQTQEEPESYSGKAAYHTIQRIEGGDWIFRDGNWLPMEKHFKHSRNLNVRPGSDVVITYDKKGRIVNIKKGDIYAN